MINWRYLTVCSQQRDSNGGSMVSLATALPTVPQLELERAQNFRVSSFMRFWVWRFGFGFGLSSGLRKLDFETNNSQSLLHIKTFLFKFWVLSLIGPLKNWALVVLSSSTASLSSGPGLWAGLGNYSSSILAATTPLVVFWIIRLALPQAAQLSIFL